jgi:outer membrane scaffolding protein for murein synthesis (MipA/OmpV family)
MAALAQPDGAGLDRIDGYTLSPAQAPLGGPVTLSTQGEPFPGRFAAAQVTVRGGLSSRSRYFGDDDYVLGPDLGFSFGYARLGGLSFGDGDPLYRPTGFGLRGSFRFIPERDGDEFDELAGLDDVDLTVEAGLGVGYATEAFEVFADARYGFFGHETFVGELGGDAIGYVGDRWTLRAGPRVIVGTDDFADTYFGVSQDEAAASSFGAFDAAGGLMSVGVELGADYRIDDDWGISAAIRVDELQGDAADSPITEEDTQLRARIGVTRRFSFGF